MLHGRELLIKGLQKKVGNGELIRVWLDPWIVDRNGNMRIPLIKNALIDLDLKMKDLIDFPSRYWNRPLLHLLFFPSDVRLILAFKPVVDRKDFWSFKSVVEGTSKLNSCLKSTEASTSASSIKTAGRPPEDWERVLDGIRKMISSKEAPVDTVECDRTGSFLPPKDPEVFRLFYVMRDTGLALEALTLICLVKACGNIFAGKEGKSVHGLSIRRGFIDQSGYLQASIIDMYVKCRLLDIARKLFETSVDRNVVMWTTLISGFAKCERAFEAFYLFRQMLGEFILPNQCTLAALLVSCSSLGSPRHGKSVHGYMIRNEIEMDAVNFTSFIDMYARCGNIQMAWKVFDLMPERNVISWSSMINAFGRNVISPDSN